MVFPGASVRRGAHVVNSVLMNGVVVGAGATVQNVLALPFDASETALRQGARAAADDRRPVRGGQPHVERP